VGTLILSLALALVSAVAGIAFMDARQSRKRLSGREAFFIQCDKERVDGHKAAIATLNEELERMRTRALLAERRVKFEEAPVAGVMKARSASSIRAMNDRWNESVIEQEQERQASTSLKVG